ncbi:hypothetical protein L7F22_001341 [Adiantum nelumboides]|nr:hypothetical protein [Adiantum nelumboides]
MECCRNAVLYDSRHDKPRALGHVRGSHEHRLVCCGNIVGGSTSELDMAGNGWPQEAATTPWPSYGATNLGAYVSTCPTVVLSSPSLAKQFLHDHDDAFAFRPAMEFSKLVFYNKGSALMQPDDPRWRAIRRLYVQEVLSSKSILSYKHVRQEEIGLLLQEIRSKANAGECVEIRSLAYRYIFNVMTSLLFSQRAMEGELSEFRVVFKALSELFGQPLISDFVPYLHWLDPGGLRRRVMLQAERMNALLQGILDQRLLLRRTNQASPADVLTVFLDSFGMPDNPDYDFVKASILELLTGSTDTTTAAVEWAMAELLCAPKSKLAGLQEEISAIVQPGGHASGVGLFGGQSYQLLMPFGRGRRGCPGNQLAATMIYLLIANFVHSFQWLPSCSSIPADEVMGMSNMLAKPFSARPHIRC